MNRRKILSFAAAGAAAGVLGATRGARPAHANDVLPPRSAILSSLRLVNDHWINGHRSPGDNKWARATYFSGNMAAHKATGDPRYVRYARRWAEQHGYGLNGGVATRHADNHCAGQTYFDLYDIDRNPQQIAAIEESMRLMTYGSNTSNSDWWWVDALHMAMPCFTRTALRRGDSTYLTKMRALYTHTKTRLWNPTDGLWYRDAKYVWPDGSRSHSPNGKKVYWSRGNGWSLAAHAKVLGLLPTPDQEYAATLRTMATALRAVQRSDGFWNVNLADPAHRGGPETSGTAFFTFGLAYGVRAGLLDRATFQPVVARAWNGMVATAVHPDGFLGYVQGVGENPDSSQPVTYGTTADFGVGAFLMAAAEVAKLAA